uniref:hypothetical protein n=1 Tax=uncultured Oceanicoccus sp. TaxID=1706381 RepID=UPI0030DB2AD0
MNKLTRVYLIIAAAFLAFFDVAYNFDIDAAYQKINNNTLSVNLTDTATEGNDTDTVYQAGEIEEARSTNETDNVDITDDTDDVDDADNDISDTNTADNHADGIDGLTVDGAESKSAGHAGAGDNADARYGSTSVRGDLADNDANSDIDASGDDIAGFSVSLESLSNTNDSSAYVMTMDEGGTDTFTVKLDAAPSFDVVLAVISSNASVTTVNGPELTFTTNHWNTPQTVTVNSIDNNTLGEGSATITLSVKEGDDAFTVLDHQTVAVTVTDNDVAGFTLLSDQLTITDGSTSTFAVKLDAEPSSDVVLAVLSSNTSVTAVNEAELTFTTNHWNTPQTVTVNGVDNNALGESSATIILSVKEGDSAFTVLENQTVAVTVIDDGTNTGGGTGGIADTGDGTDTDGTGTDGGTDSGDAGTGDGTDTGGTGTDGGTNDIAGFTLSSDSSEINDTGKSGTYTATLAEGASGSFAVKLDAQPVSNVVLAVVSTDENAIRVKNPELTFTSRKWNQDQTVIFSSVEDDNLVDERLSITLSVKGGDDAFTDVGDQTVAVTVMDNDSAGFTLLWESLSDLDDSNAYAVTMDEGSTGTFRVKLDAQPSSDVELTVKSS